MPSNGRRLRRRSTRPAAATRYRSRRRSARASRNCWTPSLSNSARRSRNRRTPRPASGPGRPFEVAAVRLAVTGGTGFVGSRLLDAAVADGHQVNALTRRPMPPRARVGWVSGSLEDRGALKKLVAGADAVIHVAGVISGRSAADFDRTNVHGTQAMLDAAKSGGVKRFVHVSSIAA